MALDTYTNLKSSIISWSHRNDTTTDLIDDFIDMAESEMWDSLRVRDMETQTTTTTAVRTLALPTGFIQLRRLRIVDGTTSRNLEFVTPEALQISSSSGIPTKYTITSQFEFDKTPDSTQTVEIQYYKRLTALSSSQTTSLILTNYPKIYLFGALWALWTYYHDDEQAVKYFSLFTEAIKSANRQNERARWGVAPMVRSEGATP